MLKDLKHLIYFEKLLENSNNELIQQAKSEGRLAVGYTCFHMPREDNGEVIWANDSFMELTEDDDDILSKKIQDLAPAFSYQNLLSDGTIGELAEMNGRSYQVYGSVSRMSGRSSGRG